MQQPEQHRRLDGDSSKCTREDPWRKADRMSRQYETNSKDRSPEVAEPINSKQLATTVGRWMLARTTAIPRIGAHSSGDFSPAFSPVRMSLGFEESVAP